MQLGITYINQISQLHPPPSLLPWVMVNNEPVGKVSPFLFLILSHSHTFPHIIYDLQIIEKILIKSTVCVSSGLCKFCTLCLQGLQRSCDSRGLQFSFEMNIIEK